MNDTFVNCAKRLEIAVIGDIMLDIHVDGDVERLSPEAPNCIVLDETSRSYTLGGAGNVALNLARFGVKTHLCGALGDKTLADTAHLRDLIDQLSREPMDGSLTLHDIPVEERRCTVKKRFWSRGQQLFRVDHEDRNPITCDKATRETLSMLAGLDAVVISDYAKGVISESVLNVLLPLLNDQGTPYFVDPKQKDFNYYCSPATNTTPEVICPNWDEWRRSKQRSNPSLKPCAKRIIVTSGRSGCAVIEFDRGLEHWVERWYKPQYDVPVADPSGAGDTFIAALTVAMMSKGSGGVDEACRIANCAAALTVTKHGVVTPDLEVLEKMVSGRMEVEA